VRPDALIPTCTRKESKKSNLRFNASQLKDSVSLNDRSGKVPFTKASLLYAPSAAVNVPGGLAASPLATPAPSLFLQAFGSGTSLHPCRLCPLGASLHLAPALRKRFVDFQPDSRSLKLLCGLNVARGLIPR